MLGCSIRAWRWNVIPLLVAFAVSLMALRSAAQSSPDALRRAQAHLAAADAAARAKDWDAALREYEAAQAQAPSALALAGLADAHYQRRHDAEAYVAYDELLKGYAHQTSLATRKLAEARLKELGARTGYVSLRITEPGATVLLDERSLGLSPVPALVRTTTGEHVVRVTKSGFAPFETKVTVGADAKVVVNVTFDRRGEVGKLAIREKSGEPVRVLLDGADVGAAPIERDLPPGIYEVAARSATHLAPKRTVTVETGKTTTVELEATLRGGRIEVRAVDPESTVILDGTVRERGEYAFDVSPGEHEVRVTREGFEPFEKRVQVAPGEVIVETVSLGRAVGAVGASQSPALSAPSRGFYGGAQLTGWALPGGSGNTVETSCASIGASTCDASAPLGAGLGGYVGYLLAPMGFELFVHGMGDVAQPVARFDGRKGSEINPLLARPAREEAFIIGRFGGGAAIRARVRHVVAPVRISAAAGVGLSYKRLVMERAATGADGSKNTFTDDQRSVGYASPALSFELSGGVVVGRSASVVLGLNLWMESAGSGVTTRASGDEALVKEGARPSPIATPPYELADGSQVYLGPFLGMHFGL